MKKAFGIITLILIAVIAIQERRIDRLQFVGEKIRVVHDTIIVAAPAPVTVVTTGQMITKLPVAKKKDIQEVISGDKGDELPVCHHEREALAEHDSIDVVVPIETKVYQDSLYRAVISGYRVSLDSMEVYRNTVHVEQFRDAGKSFYRQKRWSVSVQVGYGTDFRGIRPYVGVGVSYSLFDF
jgi:hypothetical protein